MSEFVVVVEGKADAEIATKLAERVFGEKISWLTSELIPSVLRWRGLSENEEQTHTYWKDVEREIAAGNAPRYRRKAGKSLEPDGASTMKIITHVRFLQKSNDSIRAVVLIRDLDNQPKRKAGMEAARTEDMGKVPSLAIVIGTPNRMREAWVLNGFIPANAQEKQVLASVSQQLSFDPCVEAHRLRAVTQEEPERMRNPKVVLEKLTHGDDARERQCWEETSLEHLRTHGRNTGLTDYLMEVEQWLVPLLT